MRGGRKRRDGLQEVGPYNESVTCSLQGMLAMTGHSPDCGERAFEQVQTDVLAFAVSYP